MKILVVDDSRIIRNIEKRALAELGMQDVMEANDGVEALVLTQASPGAFGLILSDWNMPNMDGLTFIKRFREQDKTTPVIMVTTEAEKSRIIEAIKAGVNNYVVKPFTAEALSGKITQTLTPRAAAPAPAAAPVA
ncbi:MAG TPA: response regulator [Phycisphaerae bacterium]|jgi:two-component system chemotaxis response regulator CheY|nr:response regulator [Phycisphaerae bacterium]